MKNFKFENWSKENCLELISSVKEVINWEDPLEVANDLLKLAIDFKSKGSPQADTYKKAHELAMENIYEGGGDPFKTALESNNPVDVVSTSLYMIADRLYNFGREGLIKNEKGEIPEGYLVAAFAQVEIIHGAFNLLSCNTDAFYKATITSKILPPIFPDKHKKIKDSIDEFIHNKQIQIGVIQPLSVFLSFLLYDKKPNPKFIVNFIDGNVCEILVKVLTGKPNEAVEMCEMFKFQNEKESIDEEKKADKSSPDNSSSSFRPFGKKDIP